MDEDVGGLPHFRKRRRAADQGGGTPQTTRKFQRCSDIGRVAAGGHANHEVTHHELNLDQILSSAIRTVLGTFDRVSERPLAARDQPYKAPRLLPKGGRDLARIEHAQSSGGARTDVDDPTSVAEGVFRRRDRGRDRDALGVDGVGDRLVLGVYQVGDLKWRGQIQVDSPGVREFGFAKRMRHGGRSGDAGGSGSLLS